MRTMSAAMQAAITARLVQPAWLVDLTFKSGTVHVWSGIGNINANGFTYHGVGNLGGIGSISETIAVEATGTSVSLSGIDATLYADSLNDIVTGKPAKIWLGCLAGNVVIDTLLIFSGLIDKPKVTETGDNIAITINLETPLTNLQRANRKLWTNAEQRRVYPNDIGFAWVEQLQDTVNIWS